MRPGGARSMIGHVPKTALKLIVGVLAAWLLLVAAISAGLRVPGIAYPIGYPAVGQLDATRPAGGFAPLSQRYIDQALGLPTGVAPGQQSAAASAAYKATTADGRGDGVAAAGRVTVVHPFTNDDFERAQPIPSIPFTGKTAMHGATRQSGEPTACAPASGTAWYRYVAPTDAALFADTFGSDFPLTLGVFDGTKLTSLQTVGCNTSATGNAQVGFRAHARHTYYLQITAAATGGNLVVDLAPLGTTTRVSLPSPGGSDNDPYTLNGWDLAMTPDGRYVAFTSYEQNLDPRHRGDPNCFSERGVACGQVYVRDRVAGTTELVSLSTSGEPGNETSNQPSISADGRYVAFESYASNLVPGDTNDVGDIFVHDRLTGVTTRESVAPNGQQFVSPEPHYGSFLGDGSFFPHLSADGRYLAFNSDATNAVSRPDCNGCVSLAFLRDRKTGSLRLVGADRNGRYPSESLRTETADGISADGRYVAFDSVSDAWGNSSCANNSNGCIGQLYRWDRITGRVVWVSRAAHGQRSDATLDQVSVALSRHGDVISFQSAASNLVAGDTNGFEDAFVWRASTRSIVRVSVSSNGTQQLNPDSSGYGDTVEFFAQQQSYTSLSADGRYVAFDSRAANLVPDDTNGVNDVFVHDLVTGSTIRVSVSSTGVQGDAASSWPVMSANGMVVAFLSAASSLGAMHTGAAHTNGDVFVHVRPAGGI